MNGRASNPWWSTGAYTFVDYATQLYSFVVLVLIAGFHNGTVPGWHWLIGGHIAQIALVHWMIQSQAHLRGNPLLTFLRYFYPVILYTAFFRETGSLNRMFFTEYMDPSLIVWEQKLFGCQPSVLFMERLPWIWVSEVFYAAYFSYYVMIAGIGIALLARNRQQFYHFVSVVSFLFYVCYTIYIILPVIGPRVFFHEIAGYQLPAEFQALAGVQAYPDTVRAGVFFKLMGWIYQLFEAPGSAMPSSHVAVALCTLYFSFRYLPRIRWIHAAVTVLLCFSVVYCRYHYVLDVIGGAATAAVLIPVGNWLYFRLAHLGAESPRESSPGVAGFSYS
jgi:membrane-associated phospholipid phosphatase